MPSATRARMLAVIRARFLFCIKKPMVCRFLVPIHRLFNFGSGDKAVIWRWRRKSPFQAFGTLPNLGIGFFAATHCRHHNVQQNQLRKAQTEGADGGQHVVVGKLHVVVGNASRHTGQTNKMHREKGQVDKDRGQPEMPFAQHFIVVVAGPFGQPVVNRRDDGKDRSRYQHIVEMRDDKIGIVVLVCLLYTSDAADE